MKVTLPAVVVVGAAVVAVAAAPGVATLPAVRAAALVDASSAPVRLVGGASGAALVEAPAGRLGSAAAVGAGSGGGSSGVVTWCAAAGAPVGGVRGGAVRVTSRSGQECGESVRLWWDSVVGTAGETTEEASRWSSAAEVDTDASSVPVLASKDRVSVAFSENSWLVGASGASVLCSVPRVSGREESSTVRSVVCKVGPNVSSLTSPTDSSVHSSAVSVSGLQEVSWP